MKKIIYCMLASSAIFSCTDDYRSNLPIGKNSVYEEKVVNKTIGNPNVIYVEDGELIYLTDTTTYYVCLGDETSEETNISSENNNLIIPMSSTQNLTVYGYDWENREEYKKIIFTDAEKVGLQPHVIYLACFTNVNKNLPLGTNQTILPRDYKNLVNVPMGWIKSNSSEVGFTLSLHQS